MIQSYYDSDEEVCWGPVTLPELKRYAMSTRSREDIESRRTIQCDPSFVDDLEKRAEDISQIEAPPTRRTIARRSSLPSRRKESNNFADEGTHSDHEMNHTPILLSDEDSFMEDSLERSASSSLDCIIIDQEVVHDNNPNDSNSSGSVICEGVVSVNDEAGYSSNEVDYNSDEEDSSIELLRENNITSGSDEVGNARDLNEPNVIDPLCSNNIISIDLTTTEMNDQDNEVSSSQSTIAEEPNIQNTSKKVDSMAGNTFIRNIAEVLRFNENFDRTNAKPIETCRQVELGIDSDLNELNVTASSCYDDLISNDVSTTETDEASSEHTCDVANEQIAMVKESELQNAIEEIDQMSGNIFIKNVAEVLHFNENILDKSTVNATKTCGQVNRELNELNITAPRCCDDIISIDLLSTNEMDELGNEVSSECTFDVTYNKIDRAKELEIHNSSKKTHNNTFFKNVAEVLNVDEKCFEKSTENASETYNRDEVGLVTNLNEPNITTIETNEQDNKIYFKRASDVYEQIKVVNEPEIQNNIEKTDIIRTRNTMEGINFHGNTYDKSNVNLPRSSSYRKIGTSGIIPLNDSYSKNYFDDTSSDDDGIMLKLNASNISNRNSSSRRRYCDDLSILNVDKLADILPMDALQDVSYINMAQRDNMDNIESSDRLVKCDYASNRKTKCEEMDLHLRHEREHSLKKREGEGEIANNDSRNPHNGSKLYSDGNISNEPKNDSVKEIPSCRLEKETFASSSPRNIDVILNRNEFIASHNEFETNYLTTKTNPVEIGGVDVLSVHEHDQRLNHFLTENANTNFNDYKSKIAFDAETPKYSKQYSKQDDPVSTNSFSFNDTLEEIEKALEGGLNYCMSASSPTSTNVEQNFNKNTIAETTPVTKNFLKTNSSEIVSYKKQTGKYYNILSPVAAYITSQSPRPIDSQFKFPGKPIKQKVSPAVKSKYKSVASPVGVYIKNAPTTPIYEKVTPTKNVQKQMETCSLEKLGNKENLSESFPEVMYKPAQHTIMRKENETRLPRQIDSLLPVKSTITKHEVRTLNHNSSVSRKLLEDDLTLNTSDSFFDVSSQDTSIRSKKRTYISKFPVFKG